MKFTNIDVLRDFYGSVMFNIIESDKSDGYYFYESAKEQQNSILFKDGKEVLIDSKFQLELDRKIRDWLMLTLPMYESMDIFSFDQVTSRDIRSFIDTPELYVASLIRNRSENSCI